jgi:DNA-directed RNA polymerase subunit RPC12/RpoP
MQLKCSKCQKVIHIAEEKIPRDKEKAMIKCPGCQQVLVFTVPQSMRKTIPQAEKTMITEGPARQKVHLPKLVHISENIDYQLKVGKNIIGRDADLSITGDRYISRRHCLVEVIEKGGEYLCILTDDSSISDSGEPSTNGTFHNGTRLTRYDKVYLDPGDKIRLGHTDFIFKNE